MKLLRFSLASLSALYATITRQELEAIDIAVLNGTNSAPKFKDHDSVVTLCRHFVPVHRKRVDDASTRVEKDANGEEIWIVEGEEMPRSEMLDLAKQYRNLPGRFE